MRLFKINGGKLQEDSSSAASKNPSLADFPQAQTEEEMVNLTHNAMEVGMHELEPSYHN